MKYNHIALSLALAGICFTSAAYADKGMYLLNAPPRAAVSERFGINLDDAWLQRAMLSAVRFNNGGSGGFVSPEGLVITNHHIADEMLAQISTPECNYLEKGFLAASRADERRAPNMELNCLQSIEDVTAQVNSAVKPSMSVSEANKARLEKMALIEKQSLDKTGLRSDVVTLYEGGAYHLYRYKKYTDVRLVWAPERSAAAFGGDVDNFAYPRRSLDAALFRVYENGQPVQVKNYFPLASKNVSENDVVFVIGHPGSTNRLHTTAWLEHHRNFTLPYRLARYRTMEAALNQYAERGAEEARRAEDPIRSVANSRKATTGMFQGLLDRNVLRRHWRQDQELALKSSCPEAWDEIAAALNNSGDLEQDYCLLEGADAYPSPLFRIARHLVRLSGELKEPSEKRLREYRDSNLESLRQNLFSEEPIYADLEKAKLTASLSFMAERLGCDHPDVMLVLQGKTPAARAKELVDGSQLFKVEERKRLAKLSLEELKKCPDAMVQLALSVDDRSRELRKNYESQVTAPLRHAYQKISRERFKVNGTADAPDATFTLRLSYGVVKGYDDDGQAVPFRTVFSDLYDKAAAMGNRAPYNLPDTWEKARTKVDMNTPMDFVSTADTIGGNSGSPVINAQGEMVGVNFDRNQFGMVRNYVYDEVQARHISVSSAAIVEALDKVYGASNLVSELRCR